MSGLALSRLRFLMLVIGAWIAATSSSSAGAPLQTTGALRWVVFASRQNPDEAIGLARRFGSQFGPPAVISTTNGWYAVAAGPIMASDPAAMKRRLSELGWPPGDSFLTNGATFIEKIWETPRSPILASASGAQKDPHVARAAGVEARVELFRGNAVVRVRSEGRIVASLAFDDGGPANSASAAIVRLDPSSPLPQVVASHFTGGAHCCTVMKIVTFTDGRWRVVNVGEFNSGGPEPEDLNGDGSAELVGKDDSFNYAFASYANPTIRRKSSG